MDELLEQFLIEGRELVLQGQADLIILLGDPGNAGAIDSAFRAIHTLKGSVGIFDMAPAERVLHAAETLLESARKAPAGISPGDVPRLVASLDQVDRWIDAMEASGSLGSGADAIAARLLDQQAETSPRAEALDPDPCSPDWAITLADREAAALANATGALVAFRYAPDSDAFFRGDDPLALIATVPGLIALAVLPAHGAWPDLATIDPFSCGMVIEGVAAAPLAALQPIFRLVPDQVAFHALEARGAPVREHSAPSSGATFLRVDAARLDALADGVGELAVAANAFSDIAHRAERIDPALALVIRAAQGDLDRAVGVVHRAVSAVRLVPLGPALARLPRLVREIAVNLGKQVAFTLSGDQIEVDKQIADGLFEPLLHLVRNALDHGIEAPETRAASGKSSEGALSLRISREGDDVLVTLADDGAGIDPTRIKALAVTRGLIDAEAAAQLADGAALRLIFAPGFSTAAQISDVSGRGVGMDAVQSAVDRLRGRIDIESQVGLGTSFRLRLPANALTTRLLVIDVGRDRYAVPFDQIAETARVEAERLVPLGTGIACVLRDRTVPVLSLAELLGGEESGLDPARLLVTRASGEPVALRVDHFSHRIDAMVRAPTGLLAGVPSIAGTALLGDGGILLVLNLPELVA
ncbi:chemotaxis protein CheW [Sphingomonas sp. BIUV-7]|uniref:histidine kinase n=1 Tax=Sphingomonas natans TaxID=3063330 RepID=A0ABT8YFV1_9SPHN|nr:ATP-binding protein [Sphingomonas sp. BIUV-7]MDO6416714.1 chemotaxis protein CheW [Sphingomonas sp. BIUV-7]